MALSNQAKEEISTIVKDALYKKYTVDLIENTIKGILNTGALNMNPKNVHVGYLGDSKTNSLKFLIAHRDAEKDDFKVDVVSISPATWEDCTASEDPDDVSDSDSTIESSL